MTYRELLENIDDSNLDDEIQIYVTGLDASYTLVDDYPMLLTDDNKLYLKI